MSQEQLRRMLGQSAADIEVGPPPAFGTLRRRQRIVVLAAAGAVMALGAGVVATRVLGDPTSPVASAAPPDGPLLVAAEPFDPSDGAPTALVAGRLTVDERGCVALETMFGSTLAVWPVGWSATVDGGELTKRDADGAPVAQEGDYVTAGGGYGPAREGVSWRRYPARGEVAQDLYDVVVTAPEPVELPTSDWRPGNPGRRALLRGSLGLVDGCVRVGETAVIWPAGFTADLDPEGRVTVFGPDGRPLAYENETVSAGGGFTTSVERGGCLASAEAVFTIQSEVTATRR